jgi:hypothetical protein
MNATEPDITVDDLDARDDIAINVTGGDTAAAPVTPLDDSIDKKHVAAIKWTRGKAIRAR